MIKEVFKNEIFVFYKTKMNNIELEIHIASVDFKYDNIVPVDVCIIGVDNTHLTYENLVTLVSEKINKSDISYSFYVYHKGINVNKKYWQKTWSTKECPLKKDKLYLKPSLVCDSIYLQYNDHSVDDIKSIYIINYRITNTGTVKNFRKFNDIISTSDEAPDGGGC